MTQARGALRRATLLVAVAALTAAGIATSTTSSQAAKPDNKGDIAKARFFSFNDFHGALDPPTGSGGLVNGTPAGGAEYLATTLKGLRADAEAQGQKTLTVGAGDMVGATPAAERGLPRRADDRDAEPRCRWTSPRSATTSSTRASPSCSACRTAAATRPTAARTATRSTAPTSRTSPPTRSYKDSGKTILPAYTTRTVQGVKVGFIGMTLEGTPGIVNPAGITDGQTSSTRSRRPTSTPTSCSAKGVEALVLLIHEGGQQNSPPTPLDPSGCANFTGALAADRRRPRPRVRPGRLRPHAPALRVPAAQLGGHADRWRPARARPARSSPTSPRR